MSNVFDILNGHINEILNREETLSKNRMDICKSCKLYIVNIIGPTCNGKLWISSDGKTSEIEKKDYVKGCGCRLDAKTRLPNAKCIINKW